MNKFKIAVVIVISVVVLLIVGLVTTHIGGNKIRTSGEVRIGQLLLSNYKVSPGVPILVTYDAIDLEGVKDASIVMLRTPQKSVVVAESSAQVVASGKIMVKIPCNSDVFDESGSNKASFVLVRNSDKRVLAQSRVFTILPPSPDCLY